MVIQPRVWQRMDPGAIDQAPLSPNRRVIGLIHHCSFIFFPSVGEGTYYLEHIRQCPVLSATHQPDMTFKGQTSVPSHNLQTEPPYLPPDGSWLHAWCLGEPQCTLGSMACSQSYGCCQDSYQAMLFWEGVQGKKPLHVHFICSKVGCRGWKARQKSSSRV